MEVPEYTISDLQTLFDQGQWTSVSLCEEFLKRISEIDTAGPTLRSVIEVNPDALTIAKALDRERDQSGPRGPLHGVPILIKDSIDTADKMQTTAGSLALEGNIAPQDAFLVEKLRDAGAVLLGKTNMSEWGYMRSTRGCSGWSSRGGQVRNPYVLDRSPLGSSSGSAVAVAANLCIAAIGAEVDGSIVRPSSTNSIVGLKPTVGLVSRSGVIGVSSPQDTAGPMARCVADVAMVLTALTGVDPRDPATQSSVDQSEQDYCQFLDTTMIKGARLGVARECFGDHEGTDAVIENAIRQLEELGAVIVDPVQASTLPMFGEVELELFLYEFKASVNCYLAEHPGAKVKNLAELIQFNRDHAEQVMPFFQQELLEIAHAKGDLNDAAYLEAKAECYRLSRTDGIDKAMNEHQLDAIIAPTEGTPAFVIDPVVGDNILKLGGSSGCSTPPALAGYPHITVPAGYVHGLPIGLSFFAGAYQEGKLISYAYAFEQATQVRRPPGFVESVSV
ncbi:amidase [Gimesia aquarii]|uniref:Glutamyl-tRNA(Gln) amidotransferase subunit A n=1 Tax=Gimesia aquarii TaxID=2527964 RepID=A0A517VTX3_9PLAN|nr:amidase [Gimesia aquarii]QDT96451.1 Glutamyl-tRNA(Gln) amidotransferase subunit A [Gimesia aquarii]